MTIKKTKGLICLPPFTGIKRASADEWTLKNGVLVMQSHLQKNGKVTFGCAPSNHRRKALFFGSD